MGYQGRTRARCLKCDGWLVSTPNPRGLVRLGGFPVESADTNHEDPACPTWVDPYTRHDCLDAQTFAALYPSELPN